MAFSPVQSLSCIWLLWPHGLQAHKTSLPFTISWSLLKLMSIELMMPSNHLVPCCPLLILPSIFPNIFLRSQFFTSDSQSIGGSASILPMNIQGWFPLGWTGWISLQSKGLSRVFSNTTLQKHQLLVQHWSNHEMTRLRKWSKRRKNKEARIPQ